MKPCLFLDRDGVIIRNVPYAKDDSAVVLMPGAADLVKSAQTQGFYVVVVTNQSGIGRGWVPEGAYRAITAKMNRLLQEQGCASFDAIYFSPYYEKATEPRWLANPEWRKPNPGMLMEACRNFKIDMSRSIVVGDRSSDIEAGANAGVPYRFLVLSQEFPDEVEKIPSGIEFATASSLTDVRLDGY